MSAPPDDGAHLTIRPLWAELDLEALAANLAAVRGRAGHDKIVIASIKANAYGHGAVGVAAALSAQGVEMLATGSFDEALAIREAGVETDILMFGACSPAGMPELLGHGFIPTVYDDALARAASRAGAARARVFVKVDCGFGRLGVALDSARGFVQRLASLPNIEIAGIYTHAPFGDPPGRAWARDAVAAFGRLVATLAADGIRIPIVQALSSAGVLAGIPDPGNAICPGHALYGLSATTPELAGGAALEPVLRALRARLIHVYRTTRSRRIAAGGKRTLPAGSVVGVAPIGLGDGYRAAPPGKTLSMLCRGTRVPVLAVSLEHTSVELTAVEGAATGDVLTVIGSDGDASITLDDVARWRGTSALEVLMSLSGRVACSTGAVAHADARGDRRQR